MKKPIMLMLYLALVAWAGSPHTKAQIAQGDVLIIKEGLIMPLPRVFVRAPFHVDPVEASLLTGKWKTPREGRIIQINDTLKSAWEPITSDEGGWFSGGDLRSGWVYMTLEADVPGVVLLEGMGHTMVYVNGVPRVGNKYQAKDEFEDWEPRFNFSLMPVPLNKGINEFLFHVSRGRLKVQIHEVKEGAYLNVRDLTLPDFIAGKSLDGWAGVVVINASSKPLKGLELLARGKGIDDSENAVPLIQPYSIKKVPFKISGQAPSEQGNTDVELKLTRSGETIDQATFPMRILQPGQPYKKTFISQIDHSVQYYAVNPVVDKNIEGPPALVLSVHGANVEAINQAGSYHNKSWANIVSPTNRRPYGYDWEDWGRIDALEVLDHAKKELGHDPSRVYLTGHSMGGHGTWILGATYPDRFAAIGPSAGWISWWSYVMEEGARERSGMEEMLDRATLPLRTLELKENFKQHGVYIIHGDEDRSVPVEQARTMVEQLSAFHKDFMYHEEPGAGHWWDNSEETGTDCVDWAPLFDFFARHARPGKQRIRRIEFKTANPGVSANNNWLTIEAQMVPLKMSAVDIQFDPGQNKFFGTTSNVFRLSFDLSVADAGRPILIDLDENVLQVEGMTGTHKKLYLERDIDRWKHLMEAPGKDEKGPHRYGTLKDAINHNVVMVFGTNGNEVENQWAQHKARYDAEVFWYQGNGAIDIIADTEFEPSDYPDRNVILYGNSQTNLAWNKLLANCPVRVSKGTMRLGDRLLTGDDLACLMVYPRNDSDHASVGVISGTGKMGMQLTNNLPYMLPGNGFPDCLVLSSDWADHGVKGIQVAGFFGNDWQIDSGDFAFQE
jgi:pimeloyl-ACP methyl ester carboxylesterase